MLKPLVIWGAGGHAKVLREFVETTGFEIVALFDNVLVESPFPGVALHSGKDGFLRWKATSNVRNTAGLVAIGGARGHDRVEIQAFMRKHGIEIIHAIHPTAFVAANARLGEGSQVLAKSVVGVEVRMGESCIVNTTASVDHECILGDGVHIAPGATLCGCVEIGNYTLVAAGAVVLPRLKIGSNVIVGAGAVVTRDIPNNAVVIGRPARVTRWQPAHDS